MALITLTMKDADRYAVIKQELGGKFKAKDASKMLMLSIRKSKRLKKKVKRYGAAGVVHGNRGKLGHIRLPDKAVKEITSLLHEHYSDFNHGLAAEKLDERYHISHDTKTIRAIMIKEKLWQPKKKKVLDNRRMG